MRTLSSTISLGRSGAGLTLTAKQYDNAGSLVASPFGTITEIGGGDYTHVGTYSDAFDGTVRIYSGATYEASFAVNPDSVAVGGTPVNTSVKVINQSVKT